MNGKLTEWGKKENILMKAILIDCVALISSFDWFCGYAPISHASPPAVAQRSYTVSLWLLATKAKHREVWNGTTLYKMKATRSSAYYANQSLKTVAL